MQNEVQRGLKIPGLRIRMALTGGPGPSHYDAKYGGDVILHSSVEAARTARLAPFLPAKLKGASPTHGSLPPPKASTAKKKISSVELKRNHAHSPTKVPI